MLTEEVRGSLAGFAGALVVLAALVGFLGVRRVASALARADPRFLVVLVLIATVWLLSWGLALRTVLSILGIPIRVTQSFLVFVAATFANNVTPFGQAGGEPFSAYLISRVTDSEYETSLAAIASVDALNFVPSIAFAIVAVGYFAATVTLTRRIEAAGVVVALLGVAVVAGAILGWRYRYELERVVVRLITPVVRGIGRLVPRLSPPTAADVERRIENFFQTIDRVAADRPSLALALSFSALGWLCNITCLWLSLYAIGHPVPFAAAMLAVPLASVASITPLPGGLGGIEAVMIAVLVPTTGGLAPATITAAVLLHRLFTYWYPLLLGGGATAALGTSVRSAA